MKIKSFQILTLIISVIVFISCEKKEDEGDKDDEKTNNNEYVNNWLLDKMQEVYLWNDKMPQRSSLNFKANPYDFYRTLLNYEVAEYSLNNPYSYIEGTHDKLPKTTKSFDQAMNDIGFEYIFFTQSGFLLISYIKPNTKAEKLGLKRGDVIWKVDDQTITENNFHKVLNNDGKQIYKLLVQRPNSGQGTKEYTLEVTPNYKENPILIDSIYTIGTQKIGYVMYNSFSAGGEDKMPYDVQLAGVFAKFQANGVTDLILDFRYNGGGLVRSVSYIVSALAPGRADGKIFENKKYNSALQARLESPSTSQEVRDSWLHEKMHNDIKTDDKVVLYNNIPKLGDQLNSIYVLGTQFTASSSEMTINTLNPFMPAGKKVKVVGESTRGKNVGSWSIYEKNDDKNTYVMHAIGFESSNIKGETSYGKKGFPADIEVDEFSNISTGLTALGDTKEPLLSAAIFDMTGVRTAKTLKSSLWKVEKRASFEQKFTKRGMIAEPKN